MRGRSAEYWVKGLLEAQGYLVIRSAASHTPIDLLAAKDSVRLAVPVKVKSGFTKEEKAELLSGLSSSEPNQYWRRREREDGFSKRWPRYPTIYLGSNSRNKACFLEMSSTRSHRKTSRFAGIYDFVPRIWTCFSVNLVSLGQ